MWGPGEVLTGPFGGTWRILGGALIRPRGGVGIPGELLGWSLGVRRAPPEVIGGDCNGVKELLDESREGPREFKRGSTGSPSGGPGVSRRGPAAVFRISWDGVLLQLREYE